MNNEKDLFRQVLQRQNERAARMKMPDDMEQRVMERIRHKKAMHRWLYPAIATVAASILLLLVFRFSQAPVKEQPVVSETIEQSIPQPIPQPIIEKKKEEVLAEVQPTPQPVRKQRKAVKKQSAPIEKPVLAQAEPMIPAEATSQPQEAPLQLSPLGREPQSIHEASVSSMSVGTDEVDPKMLLYTAEIELEKSTHQRQKAHEKEIQQRNLELLLYLMTNEEESIADGTVKTQKS